MSAWWRDDIDSLAFRPAGHVGVCVVHRRALRSLTGQDSGKEETLAFYRAEAATFQAAAAAKIERAGLAAGANLHLTSRDLRRARDVATETKSAVAILDTSRPRQ
jgi:hypothetical protein